MDTSFKQLLKANAHHLNPVVMLGAKGLTPAVIDETNIALQAHELIKVKINGGDKAERQIIANNICQALEAHLIQMIGNIAILYRKFDEKRV